MYTLWGMGANSRVIAIAVKTTAGMKQILLMIAVVALVGCGTTSWVSDPSNENNVKIEAADKDKPLPKDFKSLKALAEEGDARAQLQMGHVYRRGEGVRKDSESAAKWYYIAAKNGSPEASYYLGVAYFNGSGVEHDLVRAYVNLSVAAKAKDARAIRVKETAAKAMTPKQIATGDGLLQDPKRQTHFKFQPDCFAALVKTVGLDWVKENHVKFRPEAPKGEIIGFVDSEIGLRASWASVKLKNGDEVYISSAAGIAISDGKIALFAKQIYRANTLEATKAAIKLHQNQAIGYQTPVRMTDFLLIVFTQTALESNTREQFLKRIKNPPPKLIANLKHLAEQGGVKAARAAHILGLSYFIGEYVEKDNKEASKWFHKAAEQGHVSSQSVLGSMYLRGGMGLKEDFPSAFKWLRKAAAQGFAPAQNELGGAYHRGLGVEQDFEEAAKWFLKAAKQGNSEAQTRLGSLYLTGRGVEKDKKGGMGWFLKAAEQGNIEAQCMIGAIYRFGEGEKKDNKEAAKWFRKAANQGNAIAQYHLGAVLHEEKKEKEAAIWALKAAEQGFVEAQITIAGTYIIGKGLKQDFVKGYAWAHLAANNGHVNAVEVKLLASRTLSRLQIAEAKALSRKLLKQIEDNKAGKPKKTDFPFEPPRIDPHTGLPIWDEKK